MTEGALRGGRAEAFRALHEPGGILVLPGVWDAASARIFAAEGFPALGTTSSGIAWSLGAAAGQALPWPVFLDACRRIARAAPLPVSFDLEAGFGQTPEAVCERVREALEAGACGVNLEDGRAGGALAAPELLEESIRCIRSLCRERGLDLFVNARTDVYLGGVAEPAKQLGEAIARGQRHARAGADGFFVPGLTDPESIRRVVAEVPLPLNLYALPGLPDAEALAELGVRRVSLGCGPMQSALARTRSIARALRARGRWSTFTDDWLEYPEAVALAGGS